MGYSELEKSNIRHILADRPLLEPIFESTLNIPERVKEYDKTVFLVRNHQTRRFEIHNTETKDSFNATLPYKDLDARTIRYLKKNDVRIHGRKVFDDILKDEERKEKEQKRKEKNFIRDFATEFRGEFAKDAWK